MKKRILAIVLTVVMAMSFITVTSFAAEDLTVTLDGIDGYTYNIKGYKGTCYYNDDEELAAEQIKLDTNSVITFNFPIDFVDVWDSDNEEVAFMPDFYGQEEWTITDSVTFKGNVKTRKDVSNYEVFLLEKGDLDIDFFESGATLKFHKPGNYHMLLDVGFNNADERIAFIQKYGEFNLETGHYTLDVSFRVEDGEWVAPEEEVFVEPSSDPVTEYGEPYNKNLVSIEGIKDTYHISQYNVGQEDYIVYCTTPTIVTAQCALDDFAIYPMYYINEGQLWDEKSPIYPDGKKAQDYDWYEHHQEIYAKEPDIDLVEYVYAEKGEKYTLTKPGYYHLYGTIYDEENDYQNDIRTDIVIKITDFNAIYTSSKVLVDGQEKKFEAYNIEGNNYFKLRDIAMLLNKNNNFGQFVNITWDDTKKVVNAIRGEKYIAVGGEFAEGDGISKTAQYGASELYIDGYPQSVRAYLINGNNYFKLRDLAEIFMFDVGWDATANSVIIDTLSVLNN